MVFWEQIWVTDWGVLKYPSGSTKHPAFLQLPATPSVDQLNHPFSTTFRTAKMSQYTIDNTTFSNNANSFSNLLNNYHIADDRSPLLAWLSPLEPRLRHRDIRERRADNVGEWLFETKEFRTWHDWSGESEDDKAVLFCYGGPGVGKTFIK